MDELPPSIVLCKMLVDRVAKRNTQQTLTPAQKCKVCTGLYRFTLKFEWSPQLENNLKKKKISLKQMLLVCRVLGTGVGMGIQMVDSGLGFARKKRHLSQRGVLLLPSRRKQHASPDGTACFCGQIVRGKAHFYLEAYFSEYTLTENVLLGFK